MDDTRSLDGLKPILNQAGELRQLGKSENDLEDNGAAHTYQRFGRQRDEAAEQQTNKKKHPAGGDIPDDVPSPLEEALVARQILGQGPERFTEPAAEVAETYREESKRYERPQEQETDHFDREA